MSAKPFLDSNVLLYAYTANDLKTEMAQRLIGDGATLGVQQLNEFTNVARRKLRRSWDEIRSALNDLDILCPDPVPVTLKVHQSALEVAERYGYSFYDSLVIAAALDAGCDLLYSEDLESGRTIEGLTIRNPFGMGNKRVALRCNTYYI